MKKIRTKYPLKIGAVLIPRHEEGSMVGLEYADEVREKFPKLKEWTDGAYYLVQFPSFHKPFLCDPTQIEEIK